jgi:hypothetical protein
MVIGGDAMSDYYDDTHDDDELIEGYCVRCKMTVEMIDPSPVWTRKGMPAVRGECPECGGTVFRMGAIAAHDKSIRPMPIDVAGGGKRNLPKIAPNTVYVVYAEADEMVARQIAEDLTKSGITAWLHEHEDRPVAWAGGVHPALKECDKLLVVLSARILGDERLASTWAFFKDKRKPIIIAQLEDVSPPDSIRRSPRYDFSDYRRAFRETVQALG